jgi:putative flippase GtrA
MMHIWFKIPEKLRFLLVGGWNTLFSILLFSGLFLILKNYKFSIIISHFISVFQSFIAFRYFVFHSSKNGNFWHQYLKVNIIYLIYFALNFALLYVFVELLKIYPIASQIFITCILIIFSYLGNKHFTFKR